MKFFLYDDKNITMNDWLNNINDKPYDDLDESLYNTFKNSNLRTSDPEEADIFIVGIPFRKSYEFDNKNHNKNMTIALETLFEKKYFKKYNGKNHLLLASHHQFSAWSSMSNKLILLKYWDKLENVTCTRYLYYHMSKWENILKEQPLICVPTSLFPLWEKTKKSILVPYKAFNNINIIEPNFEEWNKRKIYIFYHTRKAGSAHGATILRHLPVKKPHLFEGSIGFDIEEKKWLKEFENSKFALVIRGDDSSSHSFVHAISLGCIPVIISDLFKIVALPFNNTIKLDDIAIQIQEKDFLEHPENVMKNLKNIPDDILENKIKKIKEIQPMLLYNHKNSIVGTMILNQMLEILK